MPGPFPAPIFLGRKALGTGLFTLPRALSHEPLKTRALKIHMQRKPIWISGSGTFNAGMELNVYGFDSVAKPHNENIQTNKQNLESHFGFLCQIIPVQTAHAYYFKTCFVSINKEFLWFI